MIPCIGWCALKYAGELITLRKRIGIRKILYWYIYLVGYCMLDQLTRSKMQLVADHSLHGRFSGLSTDSIYTDTITPYAPFNTTDVTQTDFLAPSQT